jgi:hypothetical protein
VTILSRINPLVACCVIAGILAVAYGVWGYLDFFIPGDTGCAGDPACISEITAERRLDFIATNIGMLLAFIVSLGVLVVGLVVVIAIRDRWSFGK